MSHSRFLSLPQIQRELGLTAGQVQALLDSGAVPAIRLCGAWRVERVLLESYLDSLYESRSGSAPPAQLVSPQPEPSPSSGSRSVVAVDTGDNPAAATGIAATPGQARTGLSEQQQRVLLLLAEGLSNAEIAAAMHLEVTTVKSHVSRMLQRLGLRDREGLIVYAWRSGLPRRRGGERAAR